MSERHRQLKKANARLVALLKKLIQSEQSIRDKYGIQDAMKFIPTQLHALLTRMQQDLVYDEGDEVEGKPTLLKPPSPGQVAVYIYLYHAKGQDLVNWQNMLGAKALFEMGITRPIYKAQADVEAFLSRRPHQPFFAYLIVNVNADDVLEPNEENATDKEGRPLIRLREGTLHEENIIALRHNVFGLFLYANGELRKVE